MTYLIQATLVQDEKPARYLNKFYERTVRQTGFCSTETRWLLVDNAPIARFLNRRGHNLAKVDSLERATELCRRTERKVALQKFTDPKEGWESYLTRKLGETKEFLTVDGAVRIWEETRLPTPWVYTFSDGKIVENFDFDGRDRVFRRRSDFREEGTRRLYGLVVPFASITHTRTSVTSYNRRPRR